MKKVLLSAYACSPIKGSEEGNGWSWAINLALLGYDVTCLTNFQDRDTIEEQLLVLNIKNLKFVYITLPYNLDNLLFNPSSKSVYFHYLIWRMLASKEAVKLHKLYNFDIAHHVTYGSLQQGSFLWKLNNVKFIFGPVGGGQMAVPSLKKYFGKDWRTEIIRSLISKYSFFFNNNLKKTLKKADHVLVTNSDTKELVLKSGYDKVNSLHLILDNAVPTSMEHVIYNPELKKNNKFKILWVGRMLPRKGLNLVLHALSLLDNTIDYEFNIVGGGMPSSLIYDWISEYNLDKSRVILHGQIPFERVSEFYATSDIFLFCSLRDSCPSQINEAMAYGLPCIVLNIHGSALAVPDNCGYKAEVSDANSTIKNIAVAIESLYYDRDKLKQFSENAYAYSKSNTWSKKVETVTRLYY